MTEASLAARVERLERVARRDRVLALAVLALALVTAPAPAATARGGPVAVRDAGWTTTLSASGLVTTSRSGVRRIGLGVDKRGRPGLGLFDSAGTLRQSMEIAGGRPALRQFDKAGTRRAELSLAADTDDGEFVIRDAAGVTRLAAFRGALGLPELAFYGTDGIVRAYLSATDDGPFLVMKDRSGAPRVVAGRYGSGTFGIDVRDASGSPDWTKP